MSIKRFTMKPGLLLSAFPALLCLVAGSGSAAAQSQVMADKVAAVVGNSMILYSDLVQTSKSLIEQRRQQGYTSDRDPLCEALETLIEQKILYNQAQIDSLNIDTGDIAIMVETRSRRRLRRKGPRRPSNCITTNRFSISAATFRSVMKRCAMPVACGRRSVANLQLPRGR